jgi:hypothetical protein
LLDPGVSEFRTMSRAEGSGRLETNFGVLSFFWLDLEDGSKRARVTQFVNEDAELTLKNTDDGLTFYVAAPLMKSESGGIARSSRKLSVNVNGKSFTIEHEKPRAGSEDKELVCRSIDPNGALRRNRVALQEARSYLTALVRIAKRTTSASVYGIENSLLKIVGGNGWVHATTPINEDTWHNQTGSADLVMFKGNIASLDVDGSSVTPRTIDDYTAFGEFNAQFESATKLRISGSAKAFWKNGHRMNRTRWERLTWAQQAYIGAFLFTVFGSIATYITMQVRAKMKLSWWSNLRSGGAITAIVLPET